MQLAIKILIVIAAWGFIIFRLNKNNNNKSNKVNEKKYIKYSRLYEKLTGIPLMGSSISNIKNRLYINDYNSEHILRTKAITYYFGSWLVSISLFVLLCFIYRGSLYITCLLAFICYYLKTALTDYLVGDDTKLLEELIEFIKDLKHQFNLKNSNIEAALYEAGKLSGQLMKFHSKKIEEAIKNRRDLNAYYDEAPNKYMKLIALYIYLTNEFGDAEVDGKSIFINNMNYIMEQIKIEVDKRDKLKYWLKFLTVLTVLPLLFTGMIKAWALNKFPQSTFFYNSSLDIITKIVLLAISVTCFIILREFERHSDKQVKITVKKNCWEARILKVKIIKKIVVKFTPNENSKEYYKAKNLIIDSGSYLTIEWLYLRKIISSIIVFFIVIISILGLQKINVNNVIDNTSYKFNSSEFITVGKEQLEVGEFDKEFLEEYRNKDVKKEDIVKSAKEKGVKSDKEIEKLVNRIEDKLNYIRKEHFKIYHLFIALFIALFASDIPNLKLYLDKKIRKIEMDSEIFEFYTIFLLLMYHKRVSIEMILEWMEHFSYVFKDPIKKCRNNLGNGVFESLDTLKKDCQYKPFVRIVDNLIISENIKIKDAFESLESERQFFKDEQKELNERIVAERRDIGDTLGTAPTFLLFTLYLVMPLMWACSIQFSNLYEQLKL
ncbi:hypothetical protein [Clostridium faecium]|uniref:Type II secretion system protein GspF domain-containing protein n=1 Tax=Clostridium faecium TaxID=2762223 RepID=A0ABR8YNP8_9CLOT|nr:hypothetical protein [Clostridium faecium]MBD8045845.1 hypothetical protein [Clostridium faecium]